MPQFTMNIDEGLLRAAKVYALDHGRNVSEIVRDLLSREVGWSPQPSRAPLDDTTARPVLTAYSDRRMTRRQAMDALGLAPDRYADFADAMCRLAIPWPTPDAEQIDREADVVVEAIRDARDED